MTKYMSKIKMVDGKMKLLQNKLSELGAAKGKLQEVVNKWQKLAQVADGGKK